MRTTLNICIDGFEPSERDPVLLEVETLVWEPDWEDVQLIPSALRAKPWWNEYYERLQDGRAEEQAENEAEDNG